MCDFAGMVEPEINKRRPVVVVTRRLPFRDRLAMVVPLSTSEPSFPQPFQVRLSKNYHPNEAATLPVWAKCDLVCSVSFSRLDRFKIARRKYVSPMIDQHDLEFVRIGILAALGIRR